MLVNGGSEYSTCWTPQERRYMPAATGKGTQARWGESHHRLQTRWPSQLQHSLYYSVVVEMTTSPSNFCEDHITASRGPPCPLRPRLSSGAVRREGRVPEVRATSVHAWIRVHNMPSCTMLLRDASDLIDVTKSGNAELQDSGRDRWLRLRSYCFPPSHPVPSPTRLGCLSTERTQEG